MCAMCIALCTLVFSHNSAQAKMKCKASKPEVVVKTATTRTKYIRTKSAKDLTQIHGGGASRAASSVGGLGGGEIGFKTENRFEITQRGKAACVRLKKIEVTFYAKPEIHIASNFKRSTCEYNAVLTHEQQHIRILRKFVREYSPKVKKEITRIAAQIKPSVGPISKTQIEAAQNDIQKQFMSKIEAYNNKIMPILAKRQKAFDSPQEYVRVAAKCKKWDEKFDGN